MSEDLAGGVRDGTRSFRPGDWFGILGDRASVLLPPSEKARVAGLWELVDDGAGFDEVLDAVLAGGLRGLAGFVLVSEGDNETRVVLRGAARATFVTDGETVELDGSGATTWVERSLRAVTRMVVQVADEADGADHTLTGGLVRLARLDEPAYSPDPVGRVDEEASPVVDAAPDEADVEPADDGAGGEDAPDDEVSSVVEPTSLEEPAGEAADDDADQPDEPGSGDEPARHELPTEAVDLPASWTPLPATPAPAGPAASTGADDAGPGTRAVATLAFSTGETVEVDRPILVGRAPEPGRHPTADRPHLVAVRSPHQEISSTHLEVRPGGDADEGSAVVTDLGSTNGTVLVQPGLPPEDLLAGVAVALTPGAILDLGDGVTIRVSAP